jgi:hypothetical protein
VARSWLGAIQRAFMISGAGWIARLSNCDEPTPRGLGARLGVIGPAMGSASRQDRRLVEVDRPAVQRDGVQASRFDAGTEPTERSPASYVSAVALNVHVTTSIRHAPAGSRCSNHAWVPVTTAERSCSGLSIIVRKLASLQATVPTPNI